MLSQKRDFFHWPSVAKSRNIRRERCLHLFCSTLDTRLKTKYAPEFQAHEKSYLWFPLWRSFDVLHLSVFLRNVRDRATWPFTIRFGVIQLMALLSVLKSFIYFYWQTYILNSFDGRIVVKNRSSMSSLISFVGLYFLRMSSS